MKLILIKSLFTLRGIYHSKKRHRKVHKYRPESCFLLQNNSPKGDALVPAEKRLSGVDIMGKQWSIRKLEGHEFAFDAFPGNASKLSKHESAPLVLR